eukprot:Anaeramoba_ignava/a232465_7.p1 GENE.a232465_7~~a232465_7.p1  ORF type:complete len:127 (-),score=14.86 a232465_7:318-698(-)
MKIGYRLILLLLIMLLPLSACSDKEEKKADHIRKGDEYFSAKEFKKAEIEFKNALQIDNNDTDVLLKLGDTYMKIGQTRLAFSAYSQVEKILPDNTQALLKLATFYFLNKNQEEAKKKNRNSLKER